MNSFLRMLKGPVHPFCSFFERELFTKKTQFHIRKVVMMGSVESKEINENEERATHRDPIILSHFSRVRLSATPIDSSPPVSPVSGILQARTLEWVAISFSNVWKWKVKVKLLSRVQLFTAPWTAAYQAPLSMGFSRQEYWSGSPLPSPTGTQS